MLKLVPEEPCRYGKTTTFSLSLEQIKMYFKTHLKLRKIAGLFRKKGENIMQKSSDTLLMLSKQVKQLGATDAHFRANNIKHTKGLTGVVSVYDGIKPSHMVLEELYEWAKKNNDEVKVMIENLKKDMNWNDKNPV